MTTYQAFCEDSFDGDFSQQLKKGLDELLIVKLWKKGATTEVMMMMVKMAKIANATECIPVNSDVRPFSKDVWTRCKRCKDVKQTLLKFR